MKRHIGKAAMKARLARRKARTEKQRELDELRGVRFGTPYQSPDQKKFHRWVCGVVQVSIRRAREGSRLARLERKHVDRVARGQSIRWDRALDAARAR